MYLLVTLTDRNNNWFSYPALVHGTTNLAELDDELVVPNGTEILNTYEFPSYNSVREFTDYLNEDYRRCGNYLKLKQKDIFAISKLTW